MAAAPAQILAEAATIAAPGWRDILEAAAAARAALPVQLAHNDLHPGNLLATEDAVRLADLDSAGANPRVLDVFFAALRLTDRSSAAMAAFVRAYDARAPLAPEEWAAGPTLLAADLIGKLAFILRCNAAGDGRFLKDLYPYRDYLAAALRLREAA
jgi:Ser/Thr protein kinase RdoA (MazF antagonist)